MISLPGATREAPTLVTTIMFPGLYVLHASKGDVRVNVVDRPAGTNRGTVEGLNGGKTYVTYLNPGDVIFHFGPPCDFSGVRLGDEF